MQTSSELTSMDTPSPLQHRLHESRLYFQGVRVDNVDLQEALEVVESFIRERRSGAAREVFFTNVHSIHLTRDDEEFRCCVNNADLVLPDGSGLKIAGRVFGHPIIENLNGTDFTPRVLERAEQHSWTVYLFGARPYIIERCRAKLQADYPKLKVVGQYHGHVQKNEQLSILSEINGMAPDILLVALGSPLQEKWIAQNAAGLNVGVCLAVGGLFDFLAGEYKRAPLWVRRIGAEFVYRFAQDPRSKWQRIFIEQPFFLLRVFVARVIPWRTLGFFTHPEGET